jgi:hypothetical protein
MTETRRMVRIIVKRLACFDERENHTELYTKNFKGRDHFGQDQNIIMDIREARYGIE